MGANFCSCVRSETVANEDEKELEFPVRMVPLLALDSDSKTPDEKTQQPSAIGS